MKSTSTWDTYVQEAREKGDRSIEVPVTEDESYIVPYPTRRQGRAIANATARGDTDALVIALLGEECGERVKEMAEDYPAYVLDEFLMDVMRQFGMVADEEEPAPSTDAPADKADDKPVKPAPKRRPATNGKTVRAGTRQGKSPNSRARSTTR